MKIWLLVVASLIVLMPTADGLAREGWPNNGQYEKIIKLSELVTIDEIDKEDQINLKENQINLVTASNGFQLPLPIPKRVEVEKIALHLDFIHSTALIKNRSQVLVVANGIIVSQVSLDPQNPHVIADIPIPQEYLREGYNKIEFRVSQHYTEECEDPAAPELWTQVNTIKSYFYLQYRFKQANFTLAYLDDLFDKKLIDYKLTIMRTKPIAEFTDTDLLWGGLAVQGASLRLDYKPVDLEIAIAQQRKYVKPVELESSNNPLLLLDQSQLINDLILVGTRKELSLFLNPRLKKEIEQSIDGPYLAVFPGKDPRFQVLVVSGRSEEEVTTAAQAFTLNRFAFPDHASMVVKDLQIPPVKPNTLPQILQPGVRYAFKDLGFRTISKMSHKRVEVQFKVPPDLLAREKASATFKLDFTYGAAFREDSVLNIYLNGLFEKAIYLDNKLGARFNDYEFYIPVTSFLPGLNTLRFEPVLPPLVSGKCTDIQSDNAMLTIYDSSTVELPLADHYVKLPDLKLFNRTGFPYTHVANGEEMGVLVRGQSKGAILAAWQLLAKLTQKAGMPLYKAKISFKGIADRHLLIVGDRKSLYQDDLSNAPVQLGKVFEFDYPIDKESREEKMGVMQKVKLALNPLLPDQAGSLSDIYANIKFTSYLGKDSLLLGYQSADNSDRLVMLLTNEDSDQLHQGVRRLVEPDFWDVLEDNLAVWNEDDYSLRNHKTKAEFFVGHTSLRNSLAYYYSIHKLKFLGIIFGIIVLLAWLTHRWMNRYKQRLNQDTTELEV